MAIKEIKNILPLVSKSASFNVEIADGIGVTKVLQELFACLQVDIAGTIAGTIKLQCKLDRSLEWVDITDSDYTINNSGSNVWNLREQVYPYLRLEVTISSGSGTFNIWYCSKEA